MRRMIYLYKLLNLSIIIKCERLKKSSLKLKTKKAFNIKVNELIEIMSIVNEY